MTNKPPKDNEIIHAIDELWGEYIVNTESLSKVCRQLAFAEGGLCWFFKNNLGAFPPQILKILLFLVLFFLLDAIQYLVSAVLYRGLAKYYENKNDKKLLKNKKDIIRPSWINFPARTCFISKFLSLGYASFLLIEYFISIQ